MGLGFRVCSLKGLFGSRIYFARADLLGSTRFDPFGCLMAG